MLKIRILEEGACFLEKENKTRYKMSRDILVKTFLPDNFKYTFVEREEKADICISSIQQTDISPLRDDEINILISIENCRYWKHYSGYNKFGDYGNKKINIFIYNHINSICKNENFLSIPTVYFRIDYYNKIKNSLSVKTPFKDKKFCLTISKSNLNKDINTLSNILEKYDKVDHISIYNNFINDKSCYNSSELLEVLSKYKFVICFENSYAEGYITEKIFNCFLANTIPIYLGAPDIENFLNDECFLNGNKLNLDRLNELKNNEEKYNDILQKEKISKKYNNYNYLSDMVDIINKKLPKKLICFSLWGDHEFYNYGALENAILARDIYPGWICRYYYMNCDNKILTELKKLDNVELVEMTKDCENNNMFWRFFPAFNEDNVIFISRDTDSRLNMREKLAVDEWLSSDKDFHIMRDSHYHYTHILGGMWGCRNNILKPYVEHYKFFLDNPNKKRGIDQEFLSSLYPNVIHKSIIHDSFFNIENENSKKFPDCDYKNFVGSYCVDAENAFKILNEENRSLKTKFEYQKNCF